MHEVLVAEPTGGEVVRSENGSVSIVAAVDDCAPRTVIGYRPVSVPAGAERCVVGGLLPPGAVSAEVVDDRGRRVAASVANGAYVVVLHQRDEGAEPIVCCREAGGAPVSRPPAAGYPRTPVLDATDPCPACGALDYEEYVPFQAGSSGPPDSQGRILPHALSRCRICGQEEPQPTVIRAPESAPSATPALTRAQLMAKADAMRREFMWRSVAEGVRNQNFPIYGAAGWPAQISQSGSEDDGRLTSVTVTHATTGNLNHPSHPDVTITTERDDPRHTGELERAQLALRRWAPHDDPGDRRPDGSNAAGILRHNARTRRDHAAALNAKQSQQTVKIDGQTTSALTLITPTGAWAAVANHHDLTITVTGHDLDPESLDINPIADPVKTFGPPFTE